jgi:L-aspartate oxidase
VHGANRLASNSLLEGLVFGARAAESMAGDGNPQPPEAVPSGSGPAGARRAGRPEWREDLRRRAWDSLGLERDASGLRALAAWLETARREVAPPPLDRGAAEDQNLADVAAVMAASALFREESRGAHFRTDFPALDDARFLGHTLLDAGGPRLVDVELQTVVHA